MSTGKKEANIMTIFYDKEKPRLLHWHYDPNNNGWTGFNVDLDNIQKMAKETTEPFVLMLAPTGDMPSGNPIPHMQRMATVCGEMPNILRAITIAPNSHIIGNTFARIATRALRIDQHIDIVSSENEAMRRYQQILEETR